jgi:hypothetical protein
MKTKHAALIRCGIHAGRSDAAAIRFMAADNRTGTSIVGRRAPFAPFTQSDRGLARRVRMIVSYKLLGLAASSKV